MNTSPTIAALAAALAAAQAVFRNPPRNREVQVRMKAGGTYTFRYATLDAILEQVRPILGANGLCIVQTTGEDAKGPVVTTALLHASGEWLSSDTPAFVTDGGAQAYGSAISYARRYAVVALLALAADEDDDGNAAAGNDAAPRKRKPVAIEPATDRATPTAPDWLWLAEQAVTSQAVRDLWAEAKHAGADKATLDSLVEVCRSKADYVPPQKAQPPASAPQTVAPQAQPVRADSAPPATHGDPDAMPEVARWRNECANLLTTRNGDDLWRKGESVETASLAELKIAVEVLRKRCTKAQSKLLASLAEEVGEPRTVVQQKYGVRSRAYLTATGCSAEIDRLTALRDAKVPDLRDGSGPDPDLPPFHEGGQS